MRYFIFLLMVFLISCGPVKIIEPVRWEGEPFPCFKERYCNYQNQNNADKTYCGKWADYCYKLHTFEYCRDVKNQIPVKITDRRGQMHEGTDFHSGCWDVLK